MDYLLSEEQIMVRDLARKIAQEKLKERVAEFDQQEKFPWPIIKLIAEADLFGVYIEEKYGGMGAGILELCLVTEELTLKWWGLLFL